MFQTNVAVNENTRFMFNFFPPRKSCHYEKMWKKYNRTGQVTDGNTKPRMSFASWITKATDTHSECGIRIFFPTATMVRRRGLNVTFIRALPLMFHVIFRNQLDKIVTMLKDSVVSRKVRHV